MRGPDLEILLRDGGRAGVTLRVNARARNLILRFDDRTRTFRLTLPRGVPMREAERFLVQKRDWMSACLMRAPELKLEHGALVPFLGRDHQLVFGHAKTRQTRVLDGAIYVGGPSDMAPGRLKRFMIAQARARLVPMVEAHAAALGGALAAVRLGDMRSRWGSCSSNGTVKLSWRLVMAPEEVQDYVAAHEAAHLIEMNHSQAFWALVETRHADWRAARTWLRGAGGIQLQALPFPA